MISQYIYMQQNDRWAAPAARSADPFSQIMKIKLGAALSLSLNLFALEQQQCKLRQMQSRVISMPIGKSDRKLSRKSSETVDASQKYIMCFQKGEHLKQNIEKVKNEKSRKLSTFTNLTPVHSQEAQAARSVQEEPNKKMVLSSKKVPRKVRRHFTKSYKKESRVTKMEQKQKKIKKVSLISTAEIQGQINFMERSRRRMDLLERMVKCWNPSKQQSYIKNREFRMLIRNG